MPIPIGALAQDGSSAAIYAQHGVAEKDARRLIVLYWYMWDNSTYGTMYNGGLKPAAYGFQYLNKWLVGASLDKCYQYSNGTWACHLARSGGYNAWVLWNVWGTTSFQLSSTWGMHQMRNLSGSKWSIASNAWLSVNTQPQMVESWSVF